MDISFLFVGYSSRYEISFLWNISLKTG